MSSPHVSACTLGFLFILCASVFAESQIIPITGQGWTITVDAPTFLTKKEETNANGFMFKARSGLFNISVFVETPAKTGGNKECFDFWWAKTSQFPLIDKLSIETSSNAKFHRVQYTVNGKIQDQIVTQKNVHYYFAFEGKWVNIHISITNPTAKDSGIIEAFDKGLGYAKP